MIFQRFIVTNLRYKKEKDNTIFLRHPAKSDDHRCVSMYIYNRDHFCSKNFPEVYNIHDIKNVKGESCLETRIMLLTNNSPVIHTLR